MFVENVAEAIALAATHPAAAREIYNVAPAPAVTGGSILASYPTVAEWGRMMATAAGVAPAIEARPDTQDDADSLPDFSHHLLVDGTKIHRDLGFVPPVDTARAAVETAAWLKKSADDGVRSTIR
jgi:nucleoside-diphosphate-sugar epimerase